MEHTKRLLAFDFGASSGRAILGEFDGSRISLKEVHRFSNDPVQALGTMHWDILRLFFELKQGLCAAARLGRIDGIGVDTWGVDFGLLDKDGKLLENPVHYRDARTAGMAERSYERIPQKRLYEITGNQIMEINTAFQLLSLKENRPALLERADKLLLMPDLFLYLLTGKKIAEYSIASTTQLLDAKNRTWSEEVISALGLPRHLFPEIVPCGTKIAALSDEISAETGAKSIPVIAVAGHDTQCALVSVPAEEEDFLFLSCGTWSLFGTELPAPLMDETAYRCNVTNEGGCDYKTSFLKNIIGLWLIQESRRQWKREGKEYSFADMEKAARAAVPLRCFIDPDNAVFVPAGDIPNRVRDYCKRTNQFVPETDGEVLRCMYDSLAMKYRYSAEQIERCTGKAYKAVYIVGGGTKDKLLCELTANACGKTVKAGPTEATVFGNIALQLMALGEIKDLKEARRIISASERVSEFNPQNADEWNNAYKRFTEVTGC